MSAFWFRPFSLRGRRILSHWRSFDPANAYWTSPAEPVWSPDLPPNASGRRATSPGWINEGMLEVARSQPIPAGAAAVAWVQSSALAMRVPDSSFDVVLCQQGIQFFPDTPQALREMIRVLVPGGRMFASVWEGPTPYATAMWNAVERHVGADAATMLRKSRAIEDSKALQDLMMQAGFRDVKIVCRTRTARLPAVADFILRHLAATPVAHTVEALSDSARKALSEDAATALRPYADGDGIAFPESANVLTGIR
jgi:SAM-dependent methyltransferase